MNGAHKQSIEEQEKAKFSFSGATLYGINAVIGSGIFLLLKNLFRPRTSFSSRHVRGCHSRHAAIGCLAETIQLLRLEPCNTQKPLSELRWL